MHLNVHIIYNRSFTDPIKVVRIFLMHAQMYTDFIRLRTGHTYGYKIVNLRIVCLKLTKYQLDYKFLYIRGTLRGTLSLSNDFFKRIILHTIMYGSLSDTSAHQPEENGLAEDGGYISCHDDALICSSTRNPSAIPCCVLQSTWLSKREKYNMTLNRCYELIDSNLSQGFWVSSKMVAHLVPAKEMVENTHMNFIQASLLICYFVFFFLICQSLKDVFGSFH
jgi:hypothetical protein